MILAIARPSPMTSHSYQIVSPKLDQAQISIINCIFMSPSSGR